MSRLFSRNRTIDYTHTPPMHVHSPTFIHSLTIIFMIQPFCTPTDISRNNTFPIHIVTANYNGHILTMSGISSGLILSKLASFRLALDKSNLTHNKNCQLFSSLTPSPPHTLTHTHSHRREVGVPNESGSGSACHLSPTHTLAPPTHHSGHTGTEQQQQQQQQHLKHE